jgi:hypothetical protein
MNTSNIAGSLDKTSYRAGGYTSGILGVTATECVAQAARPMSQIESQLAALADEAEQMNAAVNGLEQRLYHVLRDTQPEETKPENRPILVSHADTLLNIRNRFGCAYSRLNSILERLEA